MVVIRLARHGAKKKPFYYITVTDRAFKRDGRFIERVGFFNPLAQGQDETLRVNLQRMDHWLAMGAQPSPRVKQLLQRARAQSTATAATAAAALLAPEEAVAAEGAA